MYSRDLFDVSTRRHEEEWRSETQAACWHKPPSCCRLCIFWNASLIHSILLLNGSADVTQRSEILTDPVFTKAHKHLLLFIRPDRTQSYLHDRYHTNLWSFECMIWCFFFFNDFFKVHLCTVQKPTQRDEKLLLNKSNEWSDIQWARSKHFRQGGDV